MLTAHWLLPALRILQGVILQYDPSDLLLAALGLLNLRGFISVDRFRAIYEHLYSLCAGNTKDKVRDIYKIT